METFYTILERQCNKESLCIIYKVSLSHSILTNYILISRLTRKSNLDSFLGYYYSITNKPPDENPNTQSIMNKQSLNLNPILIRYIIWLGMSTLLEESIKNDARIRGIFPWPRSTSIEEKRYFLFILRKQRRYLLLISHLYKMWALKKRKCTRRLTCL